MSSVIFLDLPSGRKVVIRDTDVPVLLVNSSGNPFFKISSDYEDYAGKLALLSGGSMSVKKLNAADKQFVYDKLLELMSLEPDNESFMTHVWNDSGKLSVMVLYEMRNE